MLITRALRTPNAFVLASGLLLLASACPGAAFADLGATVQFNIAPQPLQNAVIQYTEQSGVQITSAAELLKGRKSAAVVGIFSASAALTKLLGGTELEFDVVDSNTVAIRAKGQNHSASSKPLTDSPSVQPPSTEGSKVPSESFRVAQVDQGASGETSSVEKKKKEVSEKKAEQLEEVVVTGSRIPQSAQQGSQEVKVYTRERIEQSGQSTVTDFLNTLPDVSIATTEIYAGNTSFGGTTVQLHGLPVGTTLVLLNGRRLETSGSQQFNDFFDLNNIPIAAVERIEVVAEGSSAVYGADAIAGIVNIILKNDFDGFEIGTRYGWDSGSHDDNASIAWGRRWDRGSVSIVGGFEARTVLMAGDRAILADQDYTRFGGVDTRSNDCNPGNVYSVSTDASGNLLPLPGSTSTFAAVSPGASGNPKRTGFVGTYGALNACNALTAIVPATHRGGILVSGDYRLTPAVTLFTELLLSRAQETQEGLPPELFGVPGFQRYTVSASNPYNPFGVDVGVSGLITGAAALNQRLDTTFFRPLLGARGDLLGDWRWEVAGWDSQDASDVTEDEAITSTVQAALDSTDPATALNPFVAGALGPPQLIQSFIAQHKAHLTGQTVAANGFVRGPILQLPSGPVVVVLGSEYRRDHLATVSGVDYAFPSLGESRTSYRRSDTAVFGEARIPLVRGNANRLSGDALAVTLAGRYDRHSDFAGKTTPQYGVEWRPAETLLFRGTYAQSFRAPTLAELHGTVSSIRTVVIDPLRNNQVDSPTELFGGNPKLNPETGRSRTFGFVYASKAIPGLQLSVTDWSIDESASIQTLNIFTLIENSDLFPGYVVRAASCAGEPPCPITLLNVTYVNFGSIKVSGFDYQLNYAYRTALGEFLPSLSATQTNRYTQALTPGAPAVDATSKANDDGNWAPRWKGTAALAWKQGAYGASISARYIGRYQDYDSANQVGNYWYYDANVRYGIGQALAPHNQYLMGAYVEVGGVNLFNRLPQYSNYGFGSFGYDPAQSDIRGRFLYARLGVKW